MSVQTTTKPTTRAALTVSPRAAIIGGVGAVLLLIAPLGLVWLYSPAIAALHIPAMNLTFTDLHHLADSGLAPTNWIQKNYFAWLGWVLIIATIVVTAAAVVIRRRAFGVAAIATSVLALILTQLAAKGTLTWSAYAHESSNTRIGVYVLIVGYLLTLVAGIMQSRRSA
jgi:hypothetical protein